VQIVQPLDTLHSVTIFEGTLHAGAHRVAVGYMASGRPMIYTAKAISIVVSEQGDCSSAGAPASVSKKNSW